MAQIFISHSKKDEDIRTYFDSIFAGTKVRAVRMEFEDLRDRPSRQIWSEIQKSDALFVLLGPNLSFSNFTENWIGFEVGIATALEKSIWVMERLGDAINFPIPYLTDYLIYDPNNKTHTKYIKHTINQFTFIPILRNFGQGIGITCPYESCKSKYSLRTQIDSFLCPTCRQEVTFKKEIDKMLSKS